MPPSSREPRWSQNFERSSACRNPLPIPTPDSRREVGVDSRCRPASVLNPNLGVGVRFPARAGLRWPALKDVRTRARATGPTIEQEQTLAVPSNPQDGGSAPGCGLPVHCDPRGGRLPAQSGGAETHLPVRDQVLEETPDSHQGGRRWSWSLSPSRCRIQPSREAEARCQLLPIVKVLLPYLGWQFC